MSAVHDDAAAARYGAGDQIGAANEITEHHVRNALALVQRGQRLNLAQPLETRSPQQPWRYWRSTLNLEHSMPGTEVGPNRLSFAEENLAGSMHSGTHLDGLGHAGRSGTLYGGHRYPDIVSADGLTKLGIEHVPPLVTRAVLLDVAAVRGERMLEDGAIGADDLEAAAARAGLEVGPGDAVILHTGWGRLWDEDPERYGTSEPGLDVSGAQWCTERRTCLIGADNWAVEAVPGGADDAFPVHQHCITDHGCYLLENVRAAELLETGARAFCLVVLPLRVVGATGSIVTPLALL
ncbi:MAG TPA: cyclase family protein [Solirubrobacteraceae bacterium]|nr:cyclase family protein [Solirubrobacteraceae bacterium]